MLQLYDLRMQAGITQKKLANDLHISAGNLCDWEKGRTEPGIEKLIELANYFDVSLDLLLGRELIPKKDKENIIIDDYKYRLLLSYDHLSPALQKKLVDLIEEFLKNK